MWVRNISLRKRYLVEPDDDNGSVGPILTNRPVIIAVNRLPCGGDARPIDALRDVGAEVLEYSWFSSGDTMPGLAQDGDLANSLSVNAA